MTSPDALPYLRAATAGLRHHSHTSTDRPTDRAHLDTLHAHLTALHQLVDRLAERTRPPHPAAGRLLSAAHTRLWQAAAAVHDAFHTLPTSTDTAPDADCDPGRLPEGPPILTICHRHLATGHAVRRKTTPADHTPLHGHTAPAS
ncbi:DUF6238 family protein [Streptomyces jumonjinensis]|uniref:DUF6238 family protein n=1 Tax=Streptomyces jumonjinensis TaxID=1945 RepID=UPI0037B849BC